MSNPQNRWQTSPGENFLELIRVNDPTVSNPVGGIDSTGAPFGSLAPVIPTPPTPAPAGAWSTVVDATVFGVVGDGKFSGAASTINNSKIITTLSTEQPFLCPGGVYPCSTPGPGSDVGSFVFATNNFIPNVGSGPVILALSTITSVDSAHQIHVSNNATATVTASPNAAGATLVWAKTDNTTALNNAWAAATTNPCGLLLLPSGGIFISGLIQNPNSTCQSSQNNPAGVINGYGVRGVSQNATILLPSIATDYTNATFAKGGAWFAVPTANSNSASKYLADFSIFGAGFAGLNAGSAIGLVGQFSSAFENLALVEWGSGAGTIGISMTGVGGDTTLLYNIQVANVNTPIQLNNVITIINSFIAGGTWVINNSATVNSYGNQYFSTVAGNPEGVFVAGGAVWNSFADTIVGPSTLGILNNGGTINMYSGSILAAGGTAYKTNIGSGTLKIINSTFSGTTAINNNASSLILDEGGNTFVGAFTNAGSYIGEANSANSVAVTAAKLVLSAGWGSTAAVTALAGGNAPIQFTVTNSGTGQGASPTITYTFPTPYPVAPFSCTAVQTGGTNPTLTFTSSLLSATGVTFTASGTPTVGDTEIIQVTCVTP